MNDLQIGSLALGVVMGLVVGVGAGAVWSLRLRRQWSAIAERAEQARQQLLMQNDQARKQVAQVQSELMAVRQQLAMRTPQTPRTEAASAPDQATAPARGPFIGLMQGETERVVDGFAATQVVFRH